MNEEDLRDCFAMFAMLGIIGMLKGGMEQVPSAQKSGAESAYEWADAMLEARNAEPNEDGIAVIKKRKYVRKN